MSGDPFLSGPGVPFPAVLSAMAVQEPDEPVIVCAGECVTRAELEAGSNRLARRLQDAGVVQGDLVALALPNSPAWFRSALAVWKLGGTVMPISPSMPVHERCELLELASPKLLVALDRALGEVGPVALPVIDPDLRSDHSEEPFEPLVAPRWKALPTGGSTGRPKIILAGWPSSFDADTGKRLFLMEPGERILITTPLSHNYAVVMSVFGLLMGSRLYVMPRFDARGALRLIADEQINFLPVVPTMMNRMLAEIRRHPDDYDLSSVRLLWHMAEPCAEWLKAAWIELLGPEVIWDLYGSTEQVAVTMISGSEWLERRGSVGRVFDGEITILDEDGEVCPPDVVGEIYMRSGEGVPPRYRYIGAETHRLPGGWETVGDMGWMDRDGYLYLSDRRVDMFTVGGRNVYPAEVEACILQHPAVASCIVVGIPHGGDLGQVPHALVELRSPASEEELLAFCGERIARYKVPRTIEFVHQPLRNDAGKARRSQIRERVMRQMAEQPAGTEGTS